jgi:F0F1-type ATP synthase assembly protein I
MKLLPSPTFARDAMRSNDSFGAAVSQGFEAIMVLAIFFGGGWALDAWLGTGPWLAIGLVLLGFVGLFYSWRARYEARMAEHEAARRSSSDVGDRGDAPAPARSADGGR